MGIGIYSTVVFIVIIIELSLAAVIFFMSNKASARLFAGLVVIHTLWVLVESVFHGTTSTTVATYTVLASHFIGSLLAGLFYLFSKTYPHDTYPRFRAFATVAVIHTLFIFAYAHNLIITDVFLIEDPQRWGWTWGDIYYLFHLTFLGFWVAGLYNIFRNTVDAKESEKSNITFTLSAMVVSVLPISVVTVLLPMIGIYQFAWIGSISSFLWIITLAYSLFLHYQSNIRAVLAQILVLSAGIILFINIFVSDSEAGIIFIPSDVVFQVIIFVAFFVFIAGYLLIVNILKESEQKEKIEDLNNELGKLNTELEGKVSDRTKALNTSKKHIEVILENLTIGIVEYSATFNVQRINKVAEQMLGVKQNDILQTKIQPAAADTTTSLSKIMFDWQSEEGKDASIGDMTYNEVRIEYPKHRELQVITIPIRIIPFVKITGFVKLLRDVTYERAVDRGKSDFIAIVAHQLSASLEATGWGITEILAEDTTEKQKDLLTKTLTSNNNLMQIVSDLLVAARIDGGEFTPQKSKNPIITLIQAQIDSFDEKAKNKHIAITFVDDIADIPDFFYDSEKIGLALRNILSNALDYTPEGGRVTITLDLINNDYVMMRIKDTGIGIPKEELDRIFTKFYRSKEALLMETDRSGLGLYITKHIVDEHEGRIEIDSEEGAGVVVTIYLPLITEQSEEESHQ